MSRFRGCLRDLTRLGVLALGLGLATGCTHALQVKNLADYQEPIRLGREQRPPRIGIEPYTGPHEAFFFFNALVERLGTSPDVEDLKTDYVAGKHDSFLPDVVLSIDHRLAYRSSGWNFFVDWPGFVALMPAWVGYGYHAEIETRIRIRDGRGQLVTEESIPMAYRMRHADMDRTVWAGLGFFPGLWSVSAFGGGIYAALEFDEDAIGGFQASVRDNYSSYVANRVLDRLAALAPPVERSTGSCFAVDRKGTVLTALDLVKDAQEIRVLLPSGEWQRAQLAQALDAEVAVLRLGRVTRGFLPVAARGAGRTGLHVLTLGHPGKVAAGVQPEIEQREIRTLSGAGPAQRLELGEPLTARHTGSPVLNDAGQVVGIVLPSDYEGGPARAVPIDAARGAVDSLSEGSGAEQREQGLRRARSALCFVEARR